MMESTLKMENKNVKRKPYSLLYALMDNAVESYSRHYSLIAWK
jgi:hypothetical protein